MELKASHNETIKRLLKAVGNKRRMTKVYFQNLSGDDYSTFWDGGSITYYTIFTLSENGQILGSHTMPTNHPYFEKHKPQQLPEISANQVVVTHGTFCGQSSWCRIYAQDSSILGLSQISAEVSNAN